MKLSKNRRMTDDSRQQCRQCLQHGLSTLFWLSCSSMLVLIRIDMHVAFNEVQHVSCYIREPTKRLLRTKEVAKAKKERAFNT